MQFEVVEDAIRESVDPSMDAEFTAFPCTLHQGNLGQVSHLFHDV